MTTFFADPWTFDICPVSAASPFGFEPFRGNMAHRRTQIRTFSRPFLNFAMRLQIIPVIMALLAGLAHAQTCSFNPQTSICASRLFFLPSEVSFPGCTSGSLEVLGCALQGSKLTCINMPNVSTIPCAAPDTVTDLFVALRRLLLLT